MESRQRIAQRQRAEHTCIAERVQADPRIVLDYARENLDRWAANYAPGRFPAWLVEWQQLLAGPLSELLDILTADTVPAAQLRATSPFVGLLTFDEKLDILRRIDPQMANTLTLYRNTCEPSGTVSEAGAKR